MLATVRRYFIESNGVKKSADEFASLSSTTVQYRITHSLRRGISIGAINSQRQQVRPTTSVNVLGGLGGRTLDECTKRTMGHTISTNLCLKPNMCGRNGKKAFGPTNFFQVVYRSIKKNPQTADCTKMNVESAVSKWLVGGRDRDGNRARRLQMASPRSPSVNGQSQ